MSASFPDRLTSDQLELRYAVECGDKKAYNECVKKCGEEWVKRELASSAMDQVFEKELDYALTCGDEKVYKECERKRGVSWIKAQILRTPKLFHSAMSSATSSSSYVACTALNMAAELKDKQNQLAETPLCNAAYEGNIAAIRLLLSARANVNTRGQLGNTPLHLAVLQDRQDIVKLLIEHGADLNAENDNCENVVECAAENDCDEMLEYLLGDKCPQDERAIKRAKRELIASAKAKLIARNQREAKAGQIKEQEEDRDLKHRGSLAVPAQNAAAAYVSSALQEATAVRNKLRQQGQAQPEVAAEVQAKKKHRLGNGEAAASSLFDTTPARFMTANDYYHPLSQSGVLDNTGEADNNDDSYSMPGWRSTNPTRSSATPTAAAAAATSTSSSSSNSRGRKRTIREASSSLTEGTNSNTLLHQIFCSFYNKSNSNATALTSADSTSSSSSSATSTAQIARNAMAAASSTSSSSGTAATAANSNVPSTRIIRDSLEPTDADLAFLGVQKVGLQFRYNPQKVRGKKFTEENNIRYYERENKLCAWRTDGGFREGYNIYYAQLFSLENRTIEKLNRTGALKRLVDSGSIPPGPYANLVQSKVIHSIRLTVVDQTTPSSSSSATVAATASATFSNVANAHRDYPVDPTDADCAILNVRKVGDQYFYDPQDGMAWNFTEENIKYYAPENKLCTWKITRSDLNYFLALYPIGLKDIRRLTDSGALDRLIAAGKIPPGPYANEADPYKQKMIKKIRLTLISETASSSSSAAVATASSAAGSR